MMTDLWNRCDECGRFISYIDFADGSAFRRFVTPDSEWSDEKYETLCKRHAPHKIDMEVPA